jgi:hypothetical protein
VRDERNFPLVSIRLCLAQGGTGRARKGLKVIIKTIAVFKLLRTESNHFFY